MLQLILRRALSIKFASLREREPFDCSILSFTCELYIMEIISHLLRSTFNCFGYTLQAFPACHRVGYYVNVFCIPARQEPILLIHIYHMLRSTKPYVCHLGTKKRYSVSAKAFTIRCFLFTCQASGTVHSDTKSISLLRHAPNSSFLVDLLEFSVDVPSVVS